MVKSKEERSEKKLPNIVNKVAGKLGLDVKEGEYIVEGGVTFKNIYTRSTNGSNFSVAGGFKIGKLAKDKDGNFIVDESIEETGDYIKDFDRLKREKTMLVTKDEAIQIALQYGLRNAYVLENTRNISEEDGKQVKKGLENNHLYPYPRTNSFFKDDRGISVFKLGIDNKKKTPVELDIDKKECSPAFLKLVEYKFEEEKAKESKKTKSNKIKQDKEIFNKILEGIESNEIVLENPFDEV